VIERHLLSTSSPRVDPLSIEIFLAMDLYAQFHTGYYEDWNVVLELKEAKRKHLKSFAFLLDLVDWCRFPCCFKPHN